MPFDIFPLPDIAYPFSPDTIGKMIISAHVLHVCCTASGCSNASEVHLVRLAKRLGPDHPSTHRALKPHFRCSACRAAGREDRNIGFIFSPGKTLTSRWPRSDINPP